MATGTRGGTGGNKPQHPFSLDGSGGTPSGNGDDTRNDNGSPTVVDPSSLAGGGSGDSGGASNGGGEPPKRGRGRPKGSGSKTGATKETVSVDTIETILFSMHGMLAALVQTPELILSQEEAKHLAVAAAEVQKFYPVRVSAKALAWSHLVMVSASIYGSRGVAIWARMETEKQNPPVVNPTNGMQPGGQTIHVLKPVQ